MLHQGLKRHHLLFVSRTDVSVSVAQMLFGHAACSAAFARYHALHTGRRCLSQVMKGIVQLTVQ